MADGLWSPVSCSDENIMLPRTLHGPPLKLHSGATLGNYKALVTFKSPLCASLMPRPMLCIFCWAWSPKRKKCSNRAPAWRNDFPSPLSWTTIFRIASLERDMMTIRSFYSAVIPLAMTHNIYFVLSRYSLLWRLKDIPCNCCRLLNKIMLHYGFVRKRPTTISRASKTCQAWHWALCIYIWQLVKHSSVHMVVEKAILIEEQGHPLRRYFDHNL